MKILQSQYTAELIKLKNNEWLDKQRIAGKVVAKALLMLANLVQQKTTLSLIQLDKLVYNFVEANGCKNTFLGYKGFPNSCCFSVNKQLVHGIATDYVLQDGDKITFDLGATYENVVADAAVTCLYGEPRKAEHSKLVMATQEALAKGIAAAKVGNCIGDIGYAIHRYAKSQGFNVITQYGGHGICTHADGSAQPHASPFVSNKGQPGTGMHIQPGMTLAIEPLLTAGPITTSVSADHWTVSTQDVSCHFEHTIFIHQDHTEIITYSES